MKKRYRTLSAIKKEAWKWFSKYIRLKYADHRGYVKCVTCGKVGHWKEMHAGHFIPKRNHAVLFEEENVHCQCPYCNTYMHGNLAQYTIFMLDTYGRETIERLIALNNTIKKFTRYELEELVEKYREKVKHAE